MSLILKNTSLSYNKRPVLRNLSLHMQAGHVTGIVGANGSGKSSLLKVIAGLQKADGEMTIGPNLDNGRLSYMPQDSVAPPTLTALDVVLLGRLKKLGLRVAEQDIQAVEAALASLGLLPLAGQAMQTLSGGQRQMVFLAQALVSNPSILLLDEPTSALDIRHQQQVLAAVQRLTKDRQLLTLLVIHDLNAALRFCDRLVLLHQGQVLAHDQAANVLSPHHVAAAFGIEVETLIREDGTLVLSPLRALESN